MRTDLFAERSKMRENVYKDKFLIKQIELARAAISDKILDLSYSDFKYYYETGSRKEYESGYFEHRKQLCAYTLLAAIYPENEKYITGLENIIWAVADEFSWALPAHIPERTGIKDCVEFIDLFAAETAFSLAEAVIIIGDRLDARVRERVEFEVRRRVIEPYLSGKENSWDKVGSNWAAVCAGSVGASFLYLAEKNEIETALPRLIDTLKCYLDSFGDDGACTEGINYWIYGFGYFTYFAELLRQYTGGEIDLFSVPKAKSIAEFPHKIRFLNNNTVTFSDCGDKFINRSGLSCFLSKKYGCTAVTDDSCSLGFNDDSCYRAAHIMRDFAWRTEEACEDIIRYGTCCFKDAQWYIKKDKMYEFAAKAGNNNESHNHNDIGSFILNVNGRKIITDPGRGEYTAEYFGERRYDYFAPSAAAHSVPVINGSMQKDGAEHKGGIIYADDSTLRLRIEKAYDDPDIIQLEREFGFKSRSVSICDKALFKAENGSMTEHFVTALMPEFLDGCIKVGDARIICDIPEDKCRISEHTFSTGYNSVKTVYTLDIEFTGSGKEIIAKLLIEF